MFKEQPFWDKDVSNVVDYRVYAPSFKDMIKRYDNYTVVNKTNPNRLAIRWVEGNGQYEGYYVTKECYADMWNRWDSWKKNHNGEIFLCIL
jgi:hypothetical protein